jgi:hypothetical protein
MSTKRFPICLFVLMVVQNGNINKNTLKPLILVLQSGALSSLNCFVDFVYRIKE